MPENIEIIILNFKTVDLDNFIFNELNILNQEIKSSHFYNNTECQDMELFQVKSLTELFTKPNTGNVVFKQLDFGISIKNVVFILSFNNDCGDIVINFPDNELILNSAKASKEKCLKVVLYIKYIMEKYNVEKVKIGYESAYDDDTCLVDIDREELNAAKIVEKICLNKF